jgi:hypothetical protein
MEFLKHLLEKHQIPTIAIFSILIIAGAYFISSVFAQPFNPGDELDPSCLPGSTNCFVDIPTSQWDDVTGGINFAGGNVGIGTTSPTDLLTISGGDIQIDDTRLIKVGTAGGFIRNSGSAIFVDGSSGYVVNQAGTAIIFRDSLSNDLMSILSTGEVGIGTSSPANKLHVYGSDTVLAKIENSATATSYIEFKSPTQQTYAGLNGTSTGVFNIQDISGVNDYIAQFFDGQLMIKGSGATSYLRLVNTGGTSYIGSLDSKFFTIADNSDDLLSIENVSKDVFIKNNLGIGTASPQSKLQVHNGKLFLTDDNVSQGITDFWPAATFTSLEKLDSSAGGLDLIGFSDGDFVGMRLQGLLGTNDPTDTTPALVLRASKFAGTNASTALSSLETAFQFKNLNTDLVTILGSGNVGIGTTTPDTTLHVDNGRLTISDEDGFAHTLTIGHIGGTGYPAYRASRHYFTDIDSTSSGTTSFNVFGNTTLDASDMLSGSGLTVVGRGGNGVVLELQDDTNSPLVTVLTTGEVGIGTTVPSELFHVKGGNFRLEDNSKNLTFTPDALSTLTDIETDNIGIQFISANGLFRFNRTSGTPDRALIYVNSGVNRLDLTGNSTGAEILSLTSGNKVGIGTTSPTISGTGKLHSAGDTARVFDTSRTPASSSEACNTGEITFDSSFIYVCVSSNTWKQATLSAF